jgi:Mn2+/Fe2+ NRAMP family transporter
VKASESRGKRHRIPAFLRHVGPGVVTGAADDDPSGIATCTQAGAQFGTGILWTVFLTLPFMEAMQLVSARIGRPSGQGIAANLRQHTPRAFLFFIVALLMVANTINIAAVFSAMGEALQPVVGGGEHFHSVLFGVLTVLLQIFLPYRRLAPVLKWLTLSLFVYVAAAFTVVIPGAQVGHDLSRPPARWQRPSAGPKGWSGMGRKRRSSAPSSPSPSPSPRSSAPAWISRRSTR